MNTKLSREFAQLIANVEAIPEGWYFLRRESNGMSKVSTWATCEIAQSVADNQGKKAQVVEYKGRFAVQIWQ